MEEVTKKCTKCNETKKIEEYHKDKSRKDGCRGQCKQCELDKKKQYYQENKDKRHEYERKRYHENEEVKTKKLLKRRFNMALNSKGAKKCNSIIELSGCELDFLKQWLEYQYKILTNKEEIDWEDFKDNYHISHVIPCDAFDLNNTEDQKKCFHWKNIQILSKDKKSNIIISQDEMKKHNKHIEEFLKIN